jgi:FkbM family methyltransferase
LAKTKKDYNFDLKWKDIIDLWACDWDSPITFSNVYFNSKVYWFEPETNNYNLFVENIKKYNKWEFVIPVQYWVSNFEWVSKFSWTWAWASIWWDEWEEIKITTIDKYVFDNNLNPWLLKWDIEWLEYNSVLWAEKTIKQFKPILFISIYHTWKDFFEIKPLIENWNLWYKFWIEKWHNGHPFADTVLVCY